MKAPSVSQYVVNCLVESLTFDTARVPNTSTTVATARLPGGFVVCTGENHTLSPATFEVQEGRRRAIDDAHIKARAKLMEFEAYVVARAEMASLWSQVHADSALPSAPPLYAETEHAKAAAGLVADGRPPHQVRVFEEKWALDDKIEKLAAFIEGNAAFLTLSSRDKGQLCRQIETMRLYSSILTERIADFK
jgi:hypothetical protein